MLGSSSLFRVSSSRRKRNEKTGTSNKKLPRSTRTTVWTIFAVLSILSSFCRSADADYFPPAPSPSHIVRETWVSVALAKPASTVYINITEYDVQQMVKNITIEFREPVSYFSLVIDVLKDKPFLVNALDNVPIIQYYAIRFATEVADKITNVTIVFTIEKATIQGRNVKEDTLLQYQYEGNKFESCPTQKVDEDDKFLYFKTETKESPYFAIAGSLASLPWWLTLVIIVVIALLTVLGMHVYKRLKCTHLRNPVRT